MHAVLIKSGRLRLVERPPGDLAPHEVRVEVERSGICGTDLHLVDRPEAEGLTPGHEVAGTVVELGSAITGSPDLQVGSRVAVLPSPRCGSCGPCRRGEEQMCTEQWQHALGFGRAGGYAESVTVPASSCFLLGEDTSFAQGALADPYAVALHGSSLAGLQPGEACVVIGAGAIGLFVVAALLAQGVTDVTVVEPAPARAEAALRLGAARAVASSEGLTEATAPDVVAVLECSGADGLVGEAIRIVRHGGTVVVLGVPPEGRTVDVAPRSWMRKEVRLVPSVWYRISDFAQAVADIGAGALDRFLDLPHGLEVRDLSEAPACFEAGIVSAIKVQLDPRSSERDGAAPRGAAAVVAS